MCCLEQGTPGWAGSPTLQGGRRCPAGLKSLMEPWALITPISVAVEEKRNEGPEGKEPRPRPVASNFTSHLRPCLCPASPAEQPLAGQPASAGPIQASLPQVAMSSGTTGLSPPPPGGQHWFRTTWQGSRQELGFLRSRILWPGCPTLV